MSDFYELTTEGNPPLTKEEAKAFLKIRSRADDEQVARMVQVALTHGETYTSRDFRANTWALLRDGFDDRICLRKSPVASVTSVKYLVSSVLTAVATSVYYLKKNVQFPEILLESGQAWPVDGDEREHNVEVVFVTEPVRTLDQAKLAMLRHVAYMYENRGDCDLHSPLAVAEAARASGADSLYDQFRIARVA